MIQDTNFTKFKYEPHKYIELFGETSAFSRNTISLTSFSDVQIPKFLHFYPIYQLLTPLFLAWQLHKNRDKDIVFVREFLTIPLLLAVPVLWPYRRNTLFVITHNSQMAHLRTRDRLAFKLLLRLRFRFVALESDEGVRALNVNYYERQLLTLPLAHYGAIQLKEHNKQEGRITVGIIGRMRPEKNINSLFGILEELNNNDRINILIGCDNKNLLDEGTKRGFQVLDTTRPEDYDKALRLSDIVLLNYDAKRYFYRDSAMIADALFRGTYVVCPDYPTFRAQVSVPTTVGSTFRSMEDIPNAIRAAISLLQKNQAPFHKYIEYRRPKNIANIIDNWLHASP